LFPYFEKSSPQPEINVTPRVHHEIRFNPRTALLNFRSLLEKPVFKCTVSHRIILFVSHLVKSTVDRVSKRTWKEQVENVKAPGGRNRPLWQKYREK